MRIDPPSTVKRWPSALAFLFACLFAVALTNVAVASGPDRRAALVIGNSAYATLPRLPNAVNDADRVGALLRDANFEVTIGKDLNKAGLEKAIRDFLRTLNDGDVALFYYSGHAVQVAGENFIIPVDANLTSSYDLQVETQNVSTLLDYMRASSSLQILVLDACRDNPFRNDDYYVGGKKVKVTTKQGLASLAPRQGSLIVYSTAPDSVAYDGGGEISPFADAFAQHALIPNKEVREVLTLVRNDVINRTGGRQVPWDVSSLTSQFYFVSAQKILVLGESVTNVRASPQEARIALGVEPPIASAGLKLQAVFEKLPLSGVLMLGDLVLTPNTPFDANRIGEVVYVSDPGPKQVELLPYKIAADGGETATGAVAIVFDETIPPPKTDTQVAAAPDDSKSVTKAAAPIEVSMKTDVGTGYASLPTVELGAGRLHGWLRVESRDPSTQIVAGEKLLMLGDLVKAEELPELRVRPSLQSTGEAQIVLAPAVVVPEARPVVIAIDAEVNACDQLAAEPLDIQAVTEGVYPNDIDVPKALEACRDAVSRFPDIARFKFQYGRALYADGQFDEALKMVKAALDAGHVRAGHFLGRLYQLGAAVPREPSKAIPLFEAAARKGDPYAQYSLGKALVEGNGVRADVKRGIGLMERAVESGHTYALNQLGAEYLYGNHVEKDVNRALVMFEKSAGRGDVWGEVNLGLMYRDGVAVNKDPARARALFEEANRKLHPYAATLVALMDRDTGASDESLLALYRTSAARGDGWGAFYAAEILKARPELATDPEEAVRLYALAVARPAGQASEDARARLAAMPKDQLVRVSQEALKRLGANDLDVDGVIGPKMRQAATAVLGKPAPRAPVDLLVEVVRHEWVGSTPRLDML
jgi:TPR repeat protein